MHIIIVGFTGGWTWGKSIIRKVKKPKSVCVPCRRQSEKWTKHAPMAIVKGMTEYAREIFCSHSTEMRSVYDHVLRRYEYAWESFVVHVLYFEMLGTIACDVFSPGYWGLCICMWYGRFSHNVKQTLWMIQTRKNRSTDESTPESSSNKQNFKKDRHYSLNHFGMFSICGCSLYAWKLNGWESSEREQRAYWYIYAYKNTACMRMYMCSCSWTCMRDRIRAHAIKAHKPHKYQQI